MNSGSIAYQYLCFFKIAEGLRKRRERLVREAIERGETPRRPVERVPSKTSEFGPWLNAIFPHRRDWDPMALESVFVTESRGRKVNDLLDKELAPLRHDVAHALFADPGEITLSPDEALHLARVEHWLPLIKCIVRRMLKNDFPEEFLPYLHEDDSVAATRA